MNAGADRANNVSAIELTYGKKIQSGGKQADPGCAANRIQQQIRRMGVGLEDRAHQFHDQRHTKHYIGIRIQGERRNDAGVENSVREGRHSEQKPN